MATSAPHTPICTPTVTPTVTPTPSPSGRAFNVAPKKAAAVALVEGARLYERNYYKVTEVIYDDHDKSKIAAVKVVNQDGIESEVAPELVDGMFCTSQYSREFKMTQTRIAVELERIGDKSARVTFYKKVEHTHKAKTLSGELLDEYVRSSDRKRMKIMKELDTGGRRVMHCKLLRSYEDDVLMEEGRYKVIDLEVEDGSKPGASPYDKGIRLIDTRTISEIIVGGDRFYTKDHKDVAEDDE